MNVPERYELFLLPDGEKKLTVQKELNVMNAATFTVRTEDHTLGNILRMQLLRNSNVVFAGYQVPHPLENVVIIRVQTTSKSSPRDAFSLAIDDLIAESTILEERFKAEVDRYQHEKSGMNVYIQ